jgi:hypothetical protein
MWYLVLPLISGMTIVFLLSQTILRNEGKALIFGIFEVSQTMLNGLIAIILLVSLGYGWKSQAISLLVSNAFFCFIGIWYMKKNGYIEMTFNKEKVNFLVLVFFMEVYFG